MFLNLIVSSKQDLTFHKIVSIEDDLHNEISKPVFWGGKKRKKNISVSFAENFTKSARH